MQSYNRFLELRGVSLCSKDSSDCILKDVELSFPHSGFFFIKGKNNSGKSALLSVLAGSDKPRTGEFIFCGTSLYQQKRSFQESYRNEMVSFVSQKDDLLEDRTVYDNIALSYQLRNRIPDIQEIKENLSLVDIKDVDAFLKRKTFFLSGSERQKVRIVRALVKGVKIFLVDELSSMDKESEEGIFKVLKKLSSDFLVIAVCNDEDIIKQYSPGMVELIDGTCKADFVKETDDFDLNVYRMEKKSRLSMLRTFRFSLEFLFARKIVLLITFAVTLVTFFLSCLSVVSLTANPTEVLVKELYAEKITDVVLNQDSSLKIGLYPESKKRGGFTDRQKETILKYTNQKELIYCYEGNSFFASGSKGMTILNYEKNLAFTPYLYETPFDLNYKGYPDGFIEMEEEDLDYTGFVLDSRLQDKEKCHFPQKFDEIALTSFKADMYLEYGYRDNDYNVIKINTLDDLIGKKLDGFAITAVYETGEDTDFAKRHSYSEGSNQMKKIENDAYLNGTYISNHWIVPRGTIEHCCQGLDNFSSDIGVYYKLPKDKHEVISLMNRLQYDEKTDFHGTWHYRGKIDSPVSSVVDQAFSNRFSMQHVLFLVVTCIFFAFDIFLVSYLIYAGLSKKKKTITSLISLGARMRDLRVICLVEEGLLCLVSFLLSIVFVVIVCNQVNTLYFCNCATFGFLAFLILFAIAILVLALSILGLRYWNNRRMRNQEK